MAKYGMAIDLNNCVGCGACALACKTENNTEYDPNDRQFNWADFLTSTEGTFKGNDVNFRVYPVLCNHCTDAPCVETCPVEPKAMYKTEDGITMHNDDRCIGCRQCQTKCPYSNKSVADAGVQYSVVSFNSWNGETHSFYQNEDEIIPNCTSNPKEIVTIAGEVPPGKNNYTHDDYDAVRRAGVTEKCIFCDHRVKNGEQPYCVVSCPSGARIFGDLDDSESDISIALTEGYTRLRNNKGEMLGSDEAGTDPNVFYIGGFNPPTSTRIIENKIAPLFVYPNPTSSNTNVKFELDSPSEISLTLFDFSGRKVQDIVSKEYRTSGEHRFSFNVSNLKTGSYVLRLVTEKDIQSANLIVTK